MTIVRPSHTYCENAIPFCLESDVGSWPVIKRMLDGKPIIMPGDGSSLWMITFNKDIARGVGVVFFGSKHEIRDIFHFALWSFFSALY